MKPTLINIAMPGHFLFIISFLIKNYTYNTSSLNEIKDFTSLLRNCYF